MFFEFKCPSCRLTSTHTENDPPTCAACGHTTRRVYSFNLKSSSPFEPHFNHSLGRVVTSQADFNEGLKLANARANAPRLNEGTELTHAIPANYTPVDLHDKEAFGVTDEGMDNFYRSRNITNPKKTIIT